MTDPLLHKAKCNIRQIPVEALKWAQRMLNDVNVIDLPRQFVLQFAYNLNEDFIYGMGYSRKLISFGFTYVNY